MSSCWYWLVVFIYFTFISELLQIVFPDFLWMYEIVGAIPSDLKNAELFNISTLT